MYDVNMHRSQLMLFEEQYQFLADEARQAGRSMSAVIREWIDKRMHGRPDHPLERDCLWDMVGIGRGGPGRVSERHDQALAAARLRRMPKRGRRPT